MIVTRTPVARRTPWGVILLIAMGTAAAGFGVWRWFSREGDAAAARPDFGRPSKPANVVIFLVDTLRADRLGCYGYEKPTSPRIDALAAESVLFEQAYTAAPWTLPTVVSLLTSTWPCEHGVLVDRQRVHPSLTPLAERMQSAGYSTASFFANPYAGPMSGLSRGYDLCQMTAPVRAAEIQPWLQSKPADKPFLLYVHNVEPHDPYNVPPHYVPPFGSVSADSVESFRERSDVYRILTRVDFDAGRDVGVTDNAADQQRALKNLDVLRPQANILYDASVRWADDYVGSVIDLLKSRGEWDNTLFILLADHGEEMGEHGGWQHDQSVYEELARIPMIVKLPHGLRAGERIRPPVTIVDVLPTIAAALEWPALARDARGTNMLAPATHEAAPKIMTMRHNLKKFFRPWKESRGDLNVALRAGRWKGIWNVESDSFELYDLEADPHEQVERSAEHPEIVGSLRKHAGTWIRECSDRAVDASHGGLDELDDETRRRLISLGYITESRAPSKPATQPVRRP